MKELKQKWNEIVRTLNERGIAVPMLRDPKTKQGSISLTLVIVSFMTWMVSIVGKAADALGGMNPDQCLNMFVVCAGLYWGRKFQKDGTKIVISEKGEIDEVLEKGN